MALKTEWVSVPLRGFCFSTNGGRRMNTKQLINVSVPLRGFCFSTSHLPVVQGAGGGGRFRPLTGILFFNRKVLSWQLKQIGKKFPSPYGDFVFQLEKFCTRCGKKFIAFPSPYGDFVFQRRYGAANNLPFAAGFRPLTGILFFNF